MDDNLASHAYLIARGVRALYISPLDDSRGAISLLLRSTSSDVVVFGSSGISGYASHNWVTDLLWWARDHAPQEQLDRIQGLLLGYSPAAIAAFEGEE